MKRIRIAIDGPSGAGKSTVARRVAEELGYAYIDTGAMYRAIAWIANGMGLDLDDEDRIVQAARGSSIRFEPSDDGGQHVYANGHDVTDAIRTPEITRLSSPVSAIGGVRRVLVAQQQTMGRAGGVVMEGRDIGTVVFPDAELKVFLTATDEERARRRWLELQARGSDTPVEGVMVQMRERDERDSNRSDSPLAAAPDAVVIDSDRLGIDEVVQRVLELARRKIAEAP
jgi:cytidylate kinase